MSASQTFRVRVVGRGGHAAIPQDTADPVVAGAAMITALQTLVSRNTSPISSNVVSITTTNAGDAFNVIPDVFEFEGTMRASTAEGIQVLNKGLHRVVEGVAAGYGVQASAEFLGVPYPATINDMHAM